MPLVYNHEVLTRLPPGTLMDIHDWRLGRLDQIREEIKAVLDLEVGPPGRFDFDLEPAAYIDNNDRIAIHDLEHPGDEGTPAGDYLEPFAYVEVVDHATNRMGLEFMRPDWSYDGPYRFKELLDDPEDIARILVAIIGQLESGEEYELDRDLWHYGANWNWETGRPIH